MDQGIIGLCKQHYLYQTHWQAVAAMNMEEAVTLREFWKGYDIYKVILNINGTWKEVTQTAMNGLWKKLCAQFVHDFKGFNNFAVTKGAGDGL